MAIKLQLYSSALKNWLRKTSGYSRVHVGLLRSARSPLVLRSNSSKNLSILLQQKLYMGLYISIVLILTAIPLLTKADNHRLPIPRFASIKANEVNARVGPTIIAPIEWVFITKGEPVEIIAEYEQWKQIRDIKGEGGWVHSSVLSGKRSVIVVSPELVSLTRVPNDQNKIVARISNYVRCLLKKCKKDYCRVCCKNYTGWLPKTVLWGVYKDEC